MKKILFLPLLRMQSGHHQVADALIDMLKKHTKDLVTKKVDLLSYTNESLEKMITSSYLKWIRFAPKTYDIAYKNFFYDPTSTEQSFRWYQHIFLKKMEQLLQEEKPDAIICTHGFPSYLLSQLKMKGKCNAPVINVYTDFFVNNVWGKEGIDFHLIPSQEVKETLIRKHHIPGNRMIVTGIPVHEKITNGVQRKQNHSRSKILIAGGNSGLGGMLKLSAELKKATNFDFYVLCGNNKKLYNEVLSWDVDHIKPLPYLSSRSEMNKLYDDVDAIITKPGGVTISEALKKRLPVFVHSFLPGQEEINLTYLKGRGLVFEISLQESLEGQLIASLKNPIKMNHWEKSISHFQKEIELEDPEKMVDIITSIMDQTYNLPSIAVSQSAILHVARA